MQDFISNRFESNGTKTFAEDMFHVTSDSTDLTQLAWFRSFMAHKLWDKMTEIEIPGIFPNILNRSNMNSRETCLLRKLSLPSQNTPCTIKDLFLNLFEPSRCKETSGFRKFEVIRTKVTAKWIWVTNLRLSPFFRSHNFDQYCIGGTKSAFKKN